MITSLGMNVHNALVYGGSSTAVSAGTGMILFAQVAQSGPEATTASTAGLLVAIAGLAAAIGPQVQIGLKLYLTERAAEREARERHEVAERELKERHEAAKEARHELSNKLQIAYLEIEDMKQRERDFEATVYFNRQLIHGLARRLGVELPDEPSTDAEIDTSIQKSDSGEYRPVA